MEARDAATVLLVRDAPPPLVDAERGARLPRSAPTSGIEVFMLRRNLRSAFVAGAHVFPGGAVDVEDRAPSTFELVDGIDDATASALLGRERGALGFWVAAIREAFEEAGVLLARDRGTGAAIRPELAIALEPARAPVAAGEQSFARLLTDHGLVLDGSSLRVLSHWITPSPAPRRYDTWFFVAPAPADHAYLHDDDETVASEWLATGDALERTRRGELELIYPTFRTLQAIGRFTSCGDLFVALDDVWRDPETPMRVVSAAHAWQVRLPGDGADADDEQEADARAHSVTGRR